MTGLEKRLARYRKGIHVWGLRFSFSCSPKMKRVLCSTSARATWKSLYTGEGSTCQEAINAIVGAGVFQQRSPDLSHDTVV